MTEKKLCFVVSPIGKADSEVRTHADWVLDGIIRPVMDKLSSMNLICAIAGAPKVRKHRIQGKVAVIWGEKLPEKIP